MRYRAIGNYVSEPGLGFTGMAVIDSAMRTPTGRAQLQSVYETGEWLPDTVTDDGRPAATTARRGIDWATIGPIAGIAGAVLLVGVVALFLRGRR